MAISQVVPAWFCRKPTRPASARAAPSLGWRARDQVHSSRRALICGCRDPRSTATEADQRRAVRVRRARTQSPDIRVPRAGKLQVRRDPQVLVRRRHRDHLVSRIGIEVADDQSFIDRVVRLKNLQGGIEFSRLRRLVEAALRTKRLEPGFQVCSDEPVRPAVDRRVHAHETAFKTYRHREGHARQSSPQTPPPRNYSHPVRGASTEHRVQRIQRREGGGLEGDALASKDHVLVYDSDVDHPVVVTDRYAGKAIERGRQSRGQVHVVDLRGGDVLAAECGERVDQLVCDAPAISGFWTRECHPDRHRRR